MKISKFHGPEVKPKWVESEQEISIWEDMDPITVDLYGDC